MSATNRYRRGFTMVELLVVIAILMVLFAILVPVVSAVRRSAEAANTAALIQSLSGAIEMYEKNFHAYPGPLSDEQIYSGNGLPTGISTQFGRPTMAENLFLGVVGGLKRVAPGPGAIIFDPNSLQSSPKVGDLSKVNGTFEPMLQSWAGDVSSGHFVDDGSNPAFDTNIPEFVDRFSNHRLPILYLRARQGASGIMSDLTSGTLYQYDIRQIRGYTASRIGLPPGAGSVHGLMNLGTQNPMDNLRLPDPNAGSFLMIYGINDALPYFKSTTTAIGTVQNANQTGTPRVKDRFMLISAGRDGIYGTRDDITSYGSVVP